MFLLLDAPCFLVSFISLTLSFVSLAISLASSLPLPKAQAAKARRSGRLPMRCDGRTARARPAAASRWSAGSCAPARASAPGGRAPSPCPAAQAIAPTTMGDALDVPLKVSVYQRSSLVPPCRSP